VASLYRLLVDINHPSLYYVGLNQTIAPFPHFHAQTEFAAACISGEFSLPDRKVNILYLILKILYPPVIIKRNRIIVETCNAHSASKL